MDENKQSPVQVKIFLLVHQINVSKWKGTMGNEISHEPGEQELREKSDFRSLGFPHIK